MELQIISFHIGNCYYRLKNYQLAIQYFERKFKEEDLKQQGLKYHNLGSCYAALRKDRLSLISYGNALKIYSQFPEVDCSNLLSNLGILYSQSGMYQTAQKYFAQSVVERMAKSPDNAPMLLFSYESLGKCQKELEKYPEAVSSLLLALNFAERGFGDYEETLKQLAQIYELMSNWSKALNYYERLLKWKQSKGHSTAFIYERVGVIYSKMKQYEESIKFTQMAMETYRRQRNQRKLSELASTLTRLRGSVADR